MFFFRTFFNLSRIFLLFKFPLFDLILLKPTIIQKRVHINIPTTRVKTFIFLRSFRSSRLLILRLLSLVLKETLFGLWVLIGICDQLIFKVVNDVLANLESLLLLLSGPVLPERHQVAHDFEIELLALCFPELLTRQRDEVGSALEESHYVVKDLDAALASPCRHVLLEPTLDDFFVIADFLDSSGGLFRWDFVATLQETLYVLKN